MTSRRRRRRPSWIKRAYRFIRREPARVATVLNIVIAEAAAHGLHLTGSTVANIFALTSLVLGEAVRSQVSPTLDH